MQDDQSNNLTGYICPECGGALSKRIGTNGTHRDDTAEYECRIGHSFTSARLWIETCAMRNRALGAAARSVAETVDLARALAAEARAGGNETLAARLEDIARTDEGSIRLLLEMLEDLVTDERDVGT